MSKSLCSIPPKYTIGIFEGIGKALAESLLDQTGHNPWSRLGSTEFRSLDGVRRSLVKRLKLSPEYKNSGSDQLMKKQSSATGFEANPLFSPPPKVLKKPKTKVFVQPGGPLGPKRENQTLPAADAKASGSQYCKKLPLLAASVVECPPISGCSASAQEEAVPADNSPKISLKKAMKKKSSSLSKVASNVSTSSEGNKPKTIKGKKKKKKSEKSSLEKLAAKK